MAIFKRHNDGGFWQLTERRGSQVWLNRNNAFHDFRPQDLVEYDTFEADSWEDLKSQVGALDHEGPAVTM